MSQLLGKHEKGSSLPQPLSGFSLSLPEATVKIRLQMKYKHTENEEVQLSGAGIRTWIPATVPHRVDKTEPLRGAHILESLDGSRFFLFCTREAASDYTHAHREGRTELQRAKDAWVKERAETEAKIVKARAEVAALEVAIANATIRFLDSSDNLAFNKAQTDLAALEGKIKGLKVKLLRPAPEQGMGAAIATQFGADSILTRAEITAAVDGEKVKLIARYKGLPDASALPMGRRVILMIEWKQPN